MTKLVEFPLESGGLVIVEVQPAAGAMVSRLSGLRDVPDEIEIGSQLSAEFGLVVAHTADQRNFRVALRWKRHVRHAVS